MFQVDGFVRWITDLRNSANHEIGGVWPGLCGVNDNSREGDTCLFPDLSADSILDRLPWLNESGQSRVPVWWEAFGAAEQKSLTVGRKGRDDDGRVGTRERKVGDGSTG